MDIDASSLEINTIQLAVEFVIAWLSVQFKYFNTKKNRNSYFESQRTQMHYIRHQIEFLYCFLITICKNRHQVIFYYSA